MRKCTAWSDLFHFSGPLLAHFPPRTLPLQQCGLNVIFGGSGVLSNRISALLGEFSMLDGDKS